MQLALALALLAGAASCASSTAPPPAAAAPAAAAPAVRLRRAPPARRAAAAAAAALTPTAAQLKWQRDEIMALVHFNMATFFHNGDPGCDANNWLGCDPRGGCNASDPASFAPTALNVSQWADSMLALGVTEAVLTAKHGCGHYNWPSKVLLPDGTRYPYAVNESFDVLKIFSDTMRARGLGHGFYYSLTNNFFLNEFSFNVRPPSTLLPRMANVTQAQFEDIVVASITELWTDYGDLDEIWFDGGYQSSLRSTITALLARLQPGALALNGEGISPSPGRWSGTEGNVPPGWPNVHSTTCCNVDEPDPAHTCEGQGCAPDDPSGTAFYAPSSTDFTLQAGDVWFFEPGAPLRSLDEMIATYHATIGANTVMELDFAIDRTGQVAPSHAALYQAFGDWRRKCYGNPVATATLLPGSRSLQLPLGAAGGGGALMDRVVLQEALAAGSYGECVANYTLEVQLPGGAWAPFGVSGAHVIGNKRIELNAAAPGAVGPAMNATAVRFNVTREYCVPEVAVSVFSPADCLLPAPPRTKVRFHYGGGGGGGGPCLVTNSSFPCAGGGADSCPLFLGDCASPMALWDDGDGATLSNLGAAGPNVVNADCNSCAAGTLMKLITGTGSAAGLAFSAAGGGTIAYSCGGAPGLCIDGGSAGGAPCDPSEPFLAAQVRVAACAEAGAQGWAREVVAA